MYQIANNGYPVILCNVGNFYMDMSVTDVLWVILDEILLVLFGCALSSIICYPLKTQGQMSAVGTIVSAGYGFICGAYMPISNFDTGLQKVLSILPGTYGTSLLKNHMLRGIFEEMSANGFPESELYPAETSTEPWALFSFCIAFTRSIISL